MLKKNNFCILEMTQIITTIGPASNTPEKIRSLVDAGADFFRLNFSHGSHAWHKETITMLRKTSPSTPIILDTKGPEMRTVDIPSNCMKISVEKNEILTLVLSENLVNISLNNKNSQKIFINHSGLGNDIEKGDIISIDSGLIETEVTGVSEDYMQISSRILYGGEITSRRHVNLVKKDVSLPTITKHDEEDIRFGLQNGVDILALSFLRCPLAVTKTRKLITEELGADKGRTIKIWGKIECQKGVDNIDILSEALDGMMVARGDLGVETPFEEVPYIQKKILATCKKQKIFSIVATEMMESMTHNPRPTRAEVSDVSLAVWQGANAVMLSGETANGEYPEKTVKIMNKIIKAAEKSKIVL